MKYLLLSVSFLFALTTVGINPKITEKKSNKKKWKLVWEDTFDKTGLPDPAIWGYEEGFVRNREAQYYTKNRLENGRIENGNLVIEARKDNWKDHEITSASLNTYGKKSMLYGKIEVRAKLPTGVGTWPAIWMLGDAMNEGVGWPACGEIDIMENVGYNPDIIHANVHTKKYNHSIGTGKGDKITIKDSYKNYHTYTLEWYEDRMEFFVDNKRFFIFENENAGNDVWPFNKPHYLILNLAIGGAWGGQQGIAEDLLPQKYYIDFVKVYEMIE